MVTEAKRTARAHWLIGLAGACALGFAVGQICPRPADTRILGSLQKNALGVDQLAARLAVLERGRSTATQCVDANELASKLQGIICDTAGARAATSPSPAPSHEAQPFEAKETQESLAIYDHLRTVVDRALRAKTWTDADYAEFRRSTPRLSPSQDEEITRTLVQAINSGELAVRTSGPPL
jgi:hypothetical protein